MMAFAAIQSYLGSTCDGGTRRLRAEMGKMTSSPSPRFSFYPAPEEKRFYQLTFHHRHRKLATNGYLPHVLEKGRDASVLRRQRKLYTNSPNRDAEYRRLLWSDVPFEHPATFNTLAMDPEQKRDIVQDMLTFQKSKETTVHCLPRPSDN